MFGFGSGQDLEKELALPFRVVLEPQEDGSFLAMVPGLPGCVARGRSKGEALKHAERAARLRLDSVPPAAFDAVFEDPARSHANALLPYYGRLVAATSRGGSLSTTTGDLGSWSSGEIVRVPGPGASAAADGDEPEDGALVDFTPQAYCLAPFSGSGVAKLYAGTSVSGAVHESVDGLHWDPCTATGEERVHCLVEFKGRLYAGTSGNGKLFCYTGGHWTLIHRSPETALVSALAFRGELYVGTYPGGQVHASPDGVQWHLAFDSGQTFVRALAEYDGRLYAATSRAGGGALFRTDNGVRWEKVFESRDPNYYCLQAFQGGLWLGTGNQGRLYRSPDGADWSLAATFEEEGLRSLASFGGRLYAAAEGRGRLYRSRFSETPPPALLDLRVEDVTSHSAVVAWRTDRPAEGLARYGVDGLTDTVASSAPVVEHRLALSRLKAETRYRLQVQSRGADFSEWSYSPEIEFATTGARTAEISSPTHPLGEGWSTRPDAELRWIPPDGVVRFHWCVDLVADTLPEPGAEGVRSTSERSASVALPREGAWWFHLRGEDRAGNLAGQAAHYPLRVDLVAPPPRLASPSHPVDGAWSREPGVRLAWEAPPDLSGVVGYHVVVDRRPSTLPTAASGPLLGEPRYSAELSEDGEWWFHAVSVDAAGNVGTEAAHYCVRLDRRADPPTLECPSHPDEERWSNSGRVEMRWSAPADLSGVAGYYHLLDRQPATVPGPHQGVYTSQESATFTGKADGAWWFHIVSVDLAGNVGVEAAHRKVLIDTQAPPPKVASPTHPAGTWVSSSRVRFEWTDPEELSGVDGYYWLLDKEGASLPGPGRGTFTLERFLEVEGLSDGVWHLRVATRDLAGNVGTEAALCTVRVDTSVLAPAPESPTHPSGEEWSRHRAAELAWEAPPDLSGISHYHWILDADPSTVPTPLTGRRCDETRVRVEVPGDGIWWFHVASQDRAGNVGAEAGHYRLKVDTEALPPVLACPTHPEPERWSRNPRPRFEWSEPPDASGVVGYVWAFDRSPDTLPGPAAGTLTGERSVAVEAPSEGEWWFHVATRDRAGNVGTEAAHRKVLIDTRADPPEVRSPTHPDREGWSHDPAPVFEWDPPADLSGIVGYYVGFNRQPGAVPTEATGAWTPEGKASFRGVEDGVWWLHVVSKDAAGNVGTEAAHYPVRIDTEALPPKVSSPTHPEGAWTRDKSPAFVWQPPRDASGVAGYHYVLDREPATVPAPPQARFTTATQAVFHGLEDGMWYLHVVTEDLAGNVGARAAHCGVCVDTSAGLARISSSTHPDPSRWYANPNPVLTWTAPADPSGISGYYTALDQNPDTVPGVQGRWSAETQAAPGPLPDGQWWFHVCCKDGAGNVGAEASHFALRVDTRAPKPKLACPSHPDPSAWSSVNRPVFTWSDGEDLSGVVAHHYSFSRDPQAAVLPSPANKVEGDRLELPPQPDGVWTFALAARDAAGNLSEPARVSLKIETQPPVARLEPLPEFTAKPAFEVRFSGEDKVSGVAGFDVEVSEGGGPWSPWISASPATSAVFTGRDGASYRFRVRARDRAGNAGDFDEKGPYVGTLVDVGPPGPVPGLKAVPGPGGSVRLEWGAAEDLASGVAGYEVWRSTDPGERGSCLSPPGGVAGTSFTDPGEGLEDGSVAHYRVVAFDRAGNRAEGGHSAVACVCDRSAEPPRLECPTHPDPAAYRNLAEAVLRWDEPPDASGVDGYLYVVDHDHDTVPGAGAAFTQRRELALPGLADGVWWVHVATRDRAGNLSRAAAHRRIAVDTGPPPAPQPRCTTHTPETWSRSGDAAFEWSVPQDPSGVVAYHWLVDASPDTVPGPDKGARGVEPFVRVAGLGEGVWWFHVAALDGAGNAGTKAGHCRLRIARTPPPPEVASPTHPRGGGAGRLAVFQWTPPAWDADVTAWRVRLDREPAAVPGPGDALTTQLRAEFPDLEPGDWCFHIVSLDADGRPGTLAAHYPFSVRSAASLAGQVTKPNGILPLEGAQLEVYRAGRPLAKATSGHDGRYDFGALEPGDVVVKFDAPGLPPLLVDGVRLEGGEVALNLSAECTAWMTASAVGSQVRFGVLVKEPGRVQVKIYAENGRPLAEVEAPALKAGHVKLSWAPQGAPEGNLLWQAAFTGADGKAVKYPIRKLKIVRG